MKNKILIIDGQGGKIGKLIILQLKKEIPNIEILAIGTNSIATSTMLKAGATLGATGENPIVVNAKDADVIVGPIGIVLANSLLGEITPAMAEAVGKSKGYKVLIPIDKCSTYVAGCDEYNLTQLIKLSVERILCLFNNIG